MEEGHLKKRKLEEKPSVIADDTSTKKKKKKKKKKSKKIEEAAAVPAVVSVPSFADNLDAADHCETPLEAYKDLVVFLDAVASRMKKTRSSLCIYDPYFCAGGVIERLGSLGFTSVRNVAEDCYQAWDKVDYDVLVTNPPYSGDHIEKMCAFLGKRKKPFAVLVPNFVVKKPYHKTLVEPLRPFFLVPRQRYIYLPPAGAREKKASDTHKKTSPFVTMWHCWSDNVQQVCDEVFRKVRDEKMEIDVCRSKNAVRDLRRK